MNYPINSRDTPVLLLGIGGGFVEFRTLVPYLKQDEVWVTLKEGVTPFCVDLSQNEYNQDRVVVLRDSNHTGVIQTTVPAQPMFYGRGGHTRILYCWWRDCKEPHLHWGKCGCCEFVDYKTPIEVQIDNWVNRLDEPLRIIYLNNATRKQFDQLSSSDQRKFLNQGGIIIPYRV